STTTDISSLYLHDALPILLSAPVSHFEIVLSYVGAAATKSILLSLIILVTATFFVPLRIEHPVWMVGFLLLTAVSFSLLGFVLGDRKSTRLNSSHVKNSYA